jgi:hypothetical protein
MMIVVMMMVMIKSRRRKAHSALQQQDCGNETLQMMTNSIHKTTRERERELS